MINRRHCAIATLVVMIGTWAITARGQVSPTPPSTTASDSPLPAQIPAVPAPVTPPASEFTSPTEAGIDAFIKPNVKNLLNDTDPVVQAKARENLASGTMYAGAPAQPAYLDMYAKELDKEFIGALGGKLSVRQRMNIAIVTQRVAIVVKNTRLQETTLLLLKDPAEPVVLWGLRAAQPVIAEGINIKPGAASPLLLAVAPAAMKHDKSGAIFDEAYQALGAENIFAVNELLKLWQVRLKKYEKEVPDEPVAEGRPVFTLTTAKMWSDVLKNNKQLQGKIMQCLSDQLALAQQWADKVGPGDVHDELVKLIQLSCGGALVVGRNLKLAPLENASKPGAQLDPKSFPAGNKVKAYTDPVIGEIANTFKAQPAPAIPAGAAPAGAVGAAPQP